VSTIDLNALEEMLVEISGAKHVPTFRAAINALFDRFGPKDFLVLIRRLRAAEKDAERYKLLRLRIICSNIQVAFDIDFRGRKPVPNGFCEITWKDIDSVDAGVDAAINQQRKIATGEDLNL
jgi:hypothetical protein